MTAEQLHIVIALLLDGLGRLGRDEVELAQAVRNRRRHRRAGGRR